MTKANDSLLCLRSRPLYRQRQAVRASIVSSAQGQVKREVKCSACGLHIANVFPPDKPDGEYRIEFAFPPVILPTNPKELVLDVLCPTCGSKTMLDARWFGAK